MTSFLLGSSPALPKNSVLPKNSLPCPKIMQFSVVPLLPTTYKEAVFSRASVSVSIAIALRHASRPATGLTMVPRTQMLHERCCMTGGSFTLGIPGLEGILPDEDAVAGFGLGAHPFSTQHRFGGPTDSPHLSVPYDPKGTVPAAGGFHVDAHSNYLGHAEDVFGK
jgi:hypothetical protein